MKTPPKQEHTKPNPAKQFGSSGGLCLSLACKLSHVHGVCPTGGKGKFSKNSWAKGQGKSKGYSSWDKSKSYGSRSW